jgi:hypothetical protein
MGCCRYARNLSLGGSVLGLRQKVCAHGNQLSDQVAAFGIPQQGAGRGK